MDYRIRPMKMADYGRACTLWKRTGGMSLEESDSKGAMAIYLRRNRGLCFVACKGDRVIGTILCGHEGRRGIVRHLAVSRRYRRRGIARNLISRCLSALAEVGIRKCNTFVLDANTEGMRFWEHMGWYLLEDNYRTLQTPTAKERSGCKASRVPPRQKHNANPRCGNPPPLRYTFPVERHG
jgi:ribosomal protein S18 acetylase RimI-like enzyme